MINRIFHSLSSTSDVNGPSNSVSQSSEDVLLYVCKPPPPYPGLIKDKADKISSGSSSTSNLSLSKENGITLNSTSKLSPATSVVSAQVHSEPHHLSNESLSLPEDSTKKQTENTDQLLESQEKFVKGSEKIFVKEDCSTLPVDSNAIIVPKNKVR